MEADRLNMSMLCVTGKKYVHKSAVIRKKTGSKIKHAISLIVTRGAKAIPQGNGELELSFKEEPSEETKWVLQNWTYIFYPSLAVYRMPYPQLVKALREALRETWRAGVELEKLWDSLRSREMRIEEESIDDPHSLGPDAIGDDTLPQPKENATEDDAHVESEVIDELAKVRRMAREIDLGGKFASHVDVNHDEKSGDTATARAIPQLWFPPRLESSRAGKGSASSASGSTGEELDLKKFLGHPSPRDRSQLSFSSTQSSLPPPSPPPSLLNLDLKPTERWSPKLSKGEFVILPPIKRPKKD